MPIMAKKNPNPLVYEPSRIKGYFVLRDPKTLDEAIAIVEESQKTLAALARGLRGDMAPETKKAFKMVLKATRYVARQPRLP